MMYKKKSKIVEIIEEGNFIISFIEQDESIFQSDSLYQTLAEIVCEESLLSMEC
ncbi:hypothetical protein [Aquibacillus kalidii]|uniref:hypothetical protein n=1 Tax=Aquibacillus kalidii TaxID=2762597 RepID=UPI001C99BD47|nr:hypothetical protein [Aquibacillus kalidii]